MNKTFDIDCELNYMAFTDCTMIFRIEAALVPEQHVLRESLTTVPQLPFQRHIDLLGNRALKIGVPAGPLSIRYRAAVELQAQTLPASVRENLRETPVDDLPLDVIPYLTGSRYVESELMFHDALQWIGTFDRGYRRVERICEWVRRNVKYEIGTSKPYGTTRDVLATRTGVCRDYAHVAIGLCRALNIPARFVVGHVMWDTPPPDFHALFEAYLDGHWVLFDPTEMADVGDVIRIGTGADAAELPFATIFGNAQMVRMAPLVFATGAHQPMLNAG